HRLILVDARGHGESDKPHERAAYTVDKHVTDIVAVLDALGVERAHYWGYSRGGWIGYGFATQAGPRLLKAAIGGQHPYENVVPPDLPDGSNSELFLRNLFQRLSADFDQVPAELKRKLLAADCRAWAAAQQSRPSQEHLLANVTAPCLIYAGED